MELHRMWRRVTWESSLVGSGMVSSPVSLVTLTQPCAGVRLLCTGRMLGGTANTPELTPSPLAEGNSKHTITELVPSTSRTLGSQMARPTPTPTPGESYRTLLSPFSCLEKGLFATFGWHCDTAV